MLNWVERHAADLWISGSNGEVVAAIDVLASARMNRQAAKEYVRTLKTPESFPTLRFFLLVTTKSIWLWKMSDRGHGYERWGDPSDTVLPKYMRTRLPMASLDEDSLRLLVFEWLLNKRELRIDPTDRAEQILDAEGFLKLVGAGNIELGTAA